MKALKYITVIMFVVGLIFKPLYFLTDVLIFGVIGNTAISLAFLLMLINTLIKKNKQGETQHRDK